MTTTASDPAFGNRQQGREPGEEGHAPERATAREVKPKRNTAGSISTIRGWSRHLHAPEVWAEDRPSIQRLWWWAAYGPQAPKRGFWRSCCIGYGLLVAIPANTVAYLAAEPLARLSGVKTTLDVGRHDRPRIQLLWAAVGTATTEGTPGWRLAVSYTAILAAGVLYQFGWLLARPTRVLAATINVYVLAHALGLSWPF